MDELKIATIKPSITNCVSSIIYRNLADREVQLKNILIVGNHFGRKADTRISGCKHRLHQDYREETFPAPEVYLKPF